MHSTNGRLCATETGPSASEEQTNKAESVIKAADRLRPNRSVGEDFHRCYAWLYSVLRIPPKRRSGGANQIGGFWLLPSALAA